ncbi:LysR family transcriptional regulator [Cronobacter universalis]|nr:LysR family transcriptional regulator [Cronobacter universalis]
MANLQDLKKFDLNLLVIFECIYLYRSVSKAAEALFLTPSAISQSLQRLRNQLNDPLFVRSGKGITPTTVGTNLHHYLEDNLNQLEQTINIMQGAPLRKNFVLYCPPALAADHLPDLVSTFREHYDFELEHYDTSLASETAEDLLAYRKADLIIGMAPVTSHSVICKHCFSEETVLVCSEKHPRLGEHVDSAALAQEKFTLFNGPAEGQKHYHVKSAELIGERQIAFTSNSLSSIMAIIGSTDFIGILPAPTLRRYGQVFGLRPVKLNFSLPQYDYYLIYNRSSLTNASFVSFVSLIEQHFLRDVPAAQRRSAASPDQPTL